VDRSIDILLHCTVCGSDVSVPADGVQLHLHVTAAWLLGSYRFTCVACHAEPVEPATPRFAGVLALADVRVTVGERAPWETPARDCRD
jgi:uncharacterized membrane protein AbrB (regulator of aidB expression)